MNGLRMGLTSAVIGYVAAAAADESSLPRYKVDIPRETLRAALEDFARETGLQVAHLSDAGDMTVIINPVVGVYTVERVLQLMLASSGFSYRLINERTIAIVRAESSSAVQPQAPENSRLVVPAASKEAPTVAPKRSGFLASFAALVMAVGAGSVHAQTSLSGAGVAPNNGELQEIVVTAQRRKENLQDVPISVEAFSAIQLESSGVRNTADLALLTPGLVFSQQGEIAQPFLRGVGTVAVGPGVENPVAIYVDGVYYGSPLGGILSLENVAQVEVDKGPQGTLFGRNATGGLIQVTTREPTETFGGYVGLTYGDYRTAGTDLYVNGGITQSLAANLAVHYLDQDQGYGRNLYNGQDITRNEDISLRNKWLFTASDATQIKLVLDYDIVHFVPDYSPAPGTTPLGPAPYPIPPHDTAGIVQPYGGNKDGGGSLEIKHDWNFAQFTSISAYRRTESNADVGASLTVDPAFTQLIAGHGTRNQLSQEFQVASHADSKITWTAGAYLYDANAGFTPPTVLSGGLFAPLTYISLFSHQKDISAALYGQATTEILPATNLTVGARYTGERRDFRADETLGFPGGSSQVFSDAQHLVITRPTWRFALDHHFTPDIMTYVSYNRGFKSGGFNDTLIPTSAFAPEVLDAYELGTKLAFFDRHLSLDATGFLYNYKNIQEIQYSNGLFAIYNGASARLYGLDLDGKLNVTAYLSLSAGVEILHSDFLSFPNAPVSVPVPGGGTAYSTGSVAGNTLPYAPDSSMNLSADYSIPLASKGSVTLTAAYAYSNGWFAEPDNRLHQPAYNLFNAQVGWSDIGNLYKVRLWGRNLTNAVYTAQLGSQGNGDYAVYAPPRTYGITIQRNF